MPKDKDFIELQDRVLVLERARRSPFGRYEFVDVTFETADTDVDVVHTLRPADPETVRWIVVHMDGDAYAYRDDSASRRAWTRGYITLRASAACTARLLLFLEPT